MTSRGRSIHTRDRASDPSRNPARSSRRCPPLRPEPTWFLATPRHFTAGVGKGREIGLGFGGHSRHITIQTFSRGCDPRGLTEGRGCDTVLFGDRSHDRVVGSDNHSHVARSRCRQVERILLGQRRGGCRWRWRCGCGGRVRCRNGLRRDLLDRSRIDGRDRGVGPDKLARSDADPGDGTGNQGAGSAAVLAALRARPRPRFGLAPPEPAESGMEPNGSVAASSAAKPESSSAAGRLSSAPAARSARRLWPISVSPTQMGSAPGSGADFDGRRPRGVTKIKTMSAR